MYQHGGKNMRASITADNLAESAAKDGENDHMYCASLGVALSMTRKPGW